MPANILNLPSYVVKGITETDHDYHIDAIPKDVPPACPHCQSALLDGFGRREQMVRDLPMHGRRVGLYIDTRRFRCKACRKTFYESPPEVNEKRLMTNRLLAWIGKQATKRTFASIAEEVGCVEGTVRLIFKDYVADLEMAVRFETPKWMGIDEIHLIRPRGVISNIANNTIVELLHNRNKDTLVRYLHHLEGKDRIQYVAMDMWAPYRDACHGVIPDARIVIDKFHVLKMANEAMEVIRKSLREQLTPRQRRGLMHDRWVLLKRERDLTDEDRLLLSGWDKNYPELGIAYRLKEDFFGIYDAKAPDEAQGLFLRWKAGIPAEMKDAYADLTRAWENWQPWILEYFDHPITNAYTESLNNLIRVMNRLGRGYSFEALRAKILFAEGAFKRKNSRPKFERKRESVRAFELMDDAVGYGLPTLPRATPAPVLRTAEPHQDETPEKNYGVDISTLTKMIEAGEL